MDKKVTIDVWQHVETDVFVYYKIAGLCHGKPYCATIGIEIDGRDGEYEHHWGESIEWIDYPERWDDFLVTMSENESLMTHLNNEADTYYAHS